MKFVKVNLKLGTQRKVYQWVVYPPTDNDTIKIQSDNSMAYIKLSDGKGIRSKDAYFRKEKESFVVTPEQLEILREAYSKIKGHLNKDGNLTIFD